MDDEEAAVLTPHTPPAKSLKELKKTYIERAKRNDVAKSSGGSAGCCSNPRECGQECGVGIGLHFELVKWLRWLFCLLMLLAVPFLVVITNTVFTDELHKESETFGIKMYAGTEIHSFTFAAIVDDTVDNGTCQYMHTRIAEAWKGPMQKGDFLIWISLVDAGAILLFVLGLTGLAIHLRSFAKQLDVSTLEASDYTVVVRGLPPGVDAAQVGEYFSRFGEVMDVVLVTDRLSATLQSCARAQRLQQRRAMVLDASLVQQSGEHLAKMQQLDDKLAALAEELQAQTGRRQQSVRAAFVTFNSENERITCTSQCPASWLRSLWQPREARFQGHVRFWVRKASAPEDYTLENLCVPEWQLFLREGLIYCFSLIMVIICAAAITKLTDLTNQERAQLPWYRADLLADVQAYLKPTSAYTPSPSAIGSIRFSSTSPASPSPPSPYEQLATGCTAALSTSCTTRLNQLYGKVASMQYGQGMQWSNTTARLLYERPIRTALQECSGSKAGPNATCGLLECLPCFCLGLSSMTTDDASDTRYDTAQQYCGQYINQYDLRTWGIRIGASLIVAALNWAIKWALQGLVLLGKHWTHTARERSYALQCFVAMLVNTVAVMLLVNCDALGRLAREGSRTAWVRYFVQYGQYADFTAAWYENVGLSVLVLMMINVSGPLLDIISDHAWQVALKCHVLRCASWPLQSQYDEAWSRPRFTLEQRTADLLLNAALALLFGSGMPLCYLVFAVYLVAADVCDRWALTRLSGVVPRYGKGLSRLVMGLLPWLAVAHCAFGLWMHTHFKVLTASQANALSGALRSTNSMLSDLALVPWSSTWERITQPNGLALLLLFVALSVWLLFGRYIVWGLLSCLGRTACAVCCPGVLRAMRLRQDTDRELNAVCYADALTGRQLHGATTYRLVHHPQYMQYFTAAGLNRALEVTGTLNAAARGGAGRHMYTRLLTVRRRGRAPGPPTFRVLQQPLVSDASLESSLPLSSDQGSSEQSLSQAPSHQPPHSVLLMAGDSVVKEPDVLLALPDRGPDRQGQGDAAAGVHPDMAALDGMALVLPPGQLGSMVRSPSVRELLEREETQHADGSRREAGAYPRYPPVPAYGVVAQGEGEQQGEGAAWVAAGGLGVDGEAGEGRRMRSGAVEAATAACIVTATTGGQLRITLPPA